MFPVHDHHLGTSHWLLSLSRQEVSGVPTPQNLNSDPHNRLKEVSNYIALLLRPQSCLTRLLAYPGGNVDGDLG